MYKANSANSIASDRPTRTEIRSIIVTPIEIITAASRLLMRDNRTHATTSINNTRQPRMMILKVFIPTPEHRSVHQDKLRASMLGAIHEAEYSGEGIEAT